MFKILKYPKPKAVNAVKKRLKKKALDVPILIILIFLKLI